MSPPLLTVRLRLEHDIVAARQRARRIAEHLGFDRIEQTRIATSVSEIARNAFMYGGGGRVEFALEGATPPQLMVVRVIDAGPGIPDVAAVLAGDYTSSSGMGLGIAGSRRLMDRFDVDSSPRGTTVTMAKLLPAGAPMFGRRGIAALVDAIAAAEPEGPLEELQHQNRELVRALDALHARQEELERVNRELEDTNRGVVALYAELDERADHLRRADELKTKFLSNMTHEFRTPVNSILALTRLLAERVDAQEGEKNEVFYIRKAAQQLSEVIDDLLDIAKVEAGKIEVRPGPFEIAGLFGALRGMLRPLLLGQSLALVFEAPDDLPPLQSDESKISQILRNFISNAVKYTERGEVRVSARLRREDGMVEFAVADTGIGIPEADLPRIFDEFVQIENPLQRRVKDTGLGLPLSRRLAELLGGRIDVQSRLGEGSTFTLTVPLVYRDAATLPGPVEVASGRQPVLVVEDSDADALIYQRFLDETDYEVVHARTEDEALAIARSKRPAAVLLDILLHGRDSWSLLARLKREADTAGIPVVVLSTVDDRRKAFALGADAVGLKPIEGAWLRRTLDSLTGAGSPVRVLAIDDEEAFRYVLRGFLSSPRLDWTEAGSGEEGWALARARRPDVVLLDLLLPGMSGVEVVRRFREDEDLSGTPFVVVTSQALTAADRALLGPRVTTLNKSELSREAVRAAVRNAVRAWPAGAQSAAS